MANDFFSNQDRARSQTGKLVVLFVLGWVPVFLFRSERFAERRAVASPDERRAMLNAVAAVGVSLTSATVSALAKLALRVTVAVMTGPLSGTRFVEREIVSAAVSLSVMVNGTMAAANPAAGKMGLA